MYISSKLHPITALMLVHKVRLTLVLTLAKKMSPSVDVKLLEYSLQSLQSLANLAPSISSISCMGHHVGHTLQWHVGSGNLCPSKE